MSRRNDTRNRAKNCRFARTVSSDKSYDFALFDIQVYIVYGMNSAVGYRQIFDLKNITHRQVPPNMRR